MKVKLMNQTNDEPSNELKCGLCQEKISLDEKVRYTKVDEKEEPVHEDCYMDVWNEAHEELENRFG